MSLTVALRASWQGKEAQSGARALATEVKALGAATKGSGAAAATAAGQQGQLATSTRNAEAATRRLSSAQVVAVQTGRDLQQSQTIAAGSVGNLAAQFNDIGMMIAAGQNPLVLAIQQGTQISQVLGPMGAAGAVRALGSAFMTLLSPINLATLAGIALGSALVQWLTSAEEQAKSFDEAMAGVESKLKTIKELNDRFTLSGIAKLAEDYGEVNVEPLVMLQRQRELAALQAFREMRAGIMAMREEMDGWRNDAGDIATFLDVDPSVVVDGFRELNPLVQQFMDLQQAAISADSFAEQATAAAQLAQMIINAAGGMENLSDGQARVVQGLWEAESRARQLAAAAPAGSWMDAATSGVGGLIGKLWEAVGAANALARAQAGAKSDVKGGRGADPRTFVTDQYWKDKYFPDPARPTSRGTGGSSGGGGGGGTKAEANAVAELIAKQERELALLREIDPVKKEMLRYSEQLAGATDQEKARLEELISTRIQEKAAIESVRSAGEMAGNALIDALMGADDAGQQLIKTLVRAGLQAALLGQGPLAGMFGSTETGGLLGLLSGAFLKKASGGYIAGPGTATSDSIPAMLSDGEFVVNARATAQNRQLLEAINSGASMPRFARGGAVGGGGGAVGAASGARPIVNIINQSSEPIREAPSDGPDVEDTVTLIVGQQTGRGRFDRQNRARFGLTPKVRRT